MKQSELFGPQLDLYLIERLKNTIITIYIYYINILLFKLRFETP
jgi:hypothetical protein